MPYIDQSTAQAAALFGELTEKDQLAILDALWEVIASRENTPDGPL